MKTKFPKDNSRHAGMNPTEKAGKKIITQRQSIIRFSALADMQQRVKLTKASV